MEPFLLTLKMAGYEQPTMKELKN